MMPGLHCKTIICIEEAKRILKSDLERLEDLEKTEPEDLLVDIADIYIKGSRNNLDELNKTVLKY